MGKYFVILDDTAKKEIQQHYKSGNKAIVRKLEKMLIELSYILIQAKANRKL